MRPSMSRRVIPALLTACGVAFASGSARAAEADLSSIPLVDATASLVPPNLMFILDDSGSMMWDYMPDNVHTTSSNQQLQNCKTATGRAQCSNATLSPAAPSTWGEPPYYAPQFNQIYYNPNISYAPGVDAAGLTLGNASPTAAKKDAYVDPTPVDLTTSYPEIYYCTTAVSTTTATDAQLDDPALCRRNGVDNVATTPSYFLYWSASSVNGGYPNGIFTRRIIRNRGIPYYFTIQPHEYCSDKNLIACQLAAANGDAPSGFALPAPVRYCRTAADASSTAAISDAVDPNVTPRCKKTFDTASGHIFPRYGRFTRTGITAATAQYTKSPDAKRPDCANAAYCTYQEELQNFANWYAYYRTRMTMMKTAAGRAFTPITDRYRVGFITINPGSPVLSPSASATDVRYLPIGTFTSTQKDDFYKVLYAQENHGGTPLRQALSRVGRHYAGVTTGINQGMGEEPLTHSCQKNFALLTTDGYWNDSAAVPAMNIGGTAIGDADDTPTPGDPVYVSRPTGTLDGDNEALVTTQDNTVVEQRVCTSNNFTSFGNVPVAGSQIRCGCSSGQRRVKQRTMTYRTESSITNGVSTPPTNTVLTTSFQDISACTTAAQTVALAPNPRVTANGPATVTTTAGGHPNTLADVAMYYYQTDLRPGTTSLALDNVSAGGKFVAKHQHMITFTLGLGLRGLMEYSDNYERDPASDFAKIKNGDMNVCAWKPGICNWPEPQANQPSTLDDLWHAAVNGRGIYYNASDPNGLSTGLSDALASLQAEDSAGAAAATSSPNITSGDNFLYSTNYKTVEWTGEVVAQTINPADGTIDAGEPAWKAQAQLDGRVSASSDTRRILKFDSAIPGKLEEFTWTNLSSATVGSILPEQAYFQDKCATMSQCTTGSMTPADMAIANDGQNLVNWLRGQRQHEGAIYRKRLHVLGDPVHAVPVFVKVPRFNFNDVVTPTYAEFKLANGLDPVSGSWRRKGVVYVAANDGMLHAFNADTGAEMWAYMPRMVFPNLHKLATASYATFHEFFVDGSPQVMDVYDKVSSAWKTILVGGLNKGGRGYYALDITDPDSPKGLWEICSDAWLCEISDADMGYSYGTPVITKRASDGRWVVLVSSGINNVGPGTGRGYLYILDAMTGAVLQKVEAKEAGTGTTCVMVGFTLVCSTSSDVTYGDTTTPSGFAKIAAFANNFNNDNTALYVYGGDLLGNIWRFDLQVNPPAVLKIGELKDASGKPQSVTTRPDIAIVQKHRVLYFGTGRYLGENDLVDYATLSPPEPWAYEQSVYAIKDKGVKYDNGSGSSNIRTSVPGLVQQVLTDTSTGRTVTNNTVDWNAKDGWYVDLNPGNTTPGERVNLDPQLVLGTLIVVGNIPKASACTPGGESITYQFDFDSGSFIPNAPGELVGVKKSQITVGVVAARLQGDKFIGIRTTPKDKDPFGVNIGGGSSAGRRISWRELVQ